MVTQTQLHNPADLAGLATGAVLGIFFLGYLMRVSVRIVARFTPGYGTVYVAMVLAMLASCASGLVVGVVRTTWHLGQPGTIQTFLVAWAIGYVVTVAVYGSVIKAPSGEPLGFIKALLANLLQLLFYFLVWAAYIVIFLGPSGYQKVLNNYRQGYTTLMKYEQSLRTGRQGLGIPATGWPASTAIMATPTPAPAARYYLKTPLSVRVSYGTIAIPANTEVRLIDQVGDSCQIQIGNATYTVSSSQLTAVP